MSLTLTRVKPINAESIYDKMIAGVSTSVEVASNDLVLA